MFVTKLKIATTLVLGMGLLGISWGLHPTRAAMPNDVTQDADPPPPSTSAAADKEGGNPSKKGLSEKKIGLPKGPPPVQALVSLTKDGKLMVKCENMVFAHLKRALPPLPPEGQEPGPHVLVRGFAGGFRAAVRTHGPFQDSYDLEEVQVLDTKGKEIEKKDLTKLLNDETLAVATFGKVDPLHLRILKEGTLVFILPPPPADGMQLPDGDQAFFPGFGLGPMTAPFMIYRTQRLVPDSCDP